MPGDSVFMQGYRAVVHEEPEGGYWAEVPDLLGCFTRGETLDVLYNHLVEAIACHLDVDVIIPSGGSPT